MTVCDCHIHSTFSFDGKDSLRAICQQAIVCGLQEICFTEHFSVDEKDVSFGVLPYESYAEELDACRRIYGEKLRIGCGLEIGEPHLPRYKEALQQALAAMDLDFIIGSVHNINSVKFRRFMQARKSPAVYQDYFAEVLAMVETSDVDIIGHLDLAKRYAYDVYGDYIFAEHEAVLRKILQQVIRRGIGIEVNTSGLRNSVGELYPSPAILRLYKDLGGEIITVGSDAHACADLGRSIRKVYGLLKTIGFSGVYTYARRQPKKIPFDR